MKKVLFIAHSFPPKGGGGVQRTVKFVKYLPQFGWQPTVLTASIPWTVRDPSITSDVPPQTPIARVRGLALPPRLPWRLRRWVTRWLFTVDEHIGWLPFAARRGLALLRQPGWRAIYSTSLPYTDHLVAWRLQCATHLPWVADFRDPWLDNFSASFATPAHRALCAHLEKKVVSSAGRVLVVSEPMRQQFLARYSGLSPAHFITLPNGFDRDDFEGVVPVVYDARCTIVYTGSLYGKQQSARPFLTALSQVLDREVVQRTDICVRFVGNAGREAQELVSSWGLGDVVEFSGYLPHAEMIGHQLGADVLLLIIGAGAGSEAVLTGKIFEYLAAAKPILALVPPGAAADLVQQARAGVVVNNNPGAIAEHIVALYRQWRQGELKIIPDDEIIARYDRRQLTCQLAAILDAVSG